MHSGRDFGLMVGAALGFIGLIGLLMLLVTSLL